MARKGHTHAASSRASSNERFGRGEVEGAGELETPHNGPGSSKETRGKVAKEAYPSRKTPGAGKVSASQESDDDD